MSEVLCGVCNTNPKKYKCPTCALPYCSIQCFKDHKTTHLDSASTSKPSPSTDPALPQPPPPAPVPRYLKGKIDFSVLATSSEFQALIKTYPTLLPLLQRVYAATIEPDPEDEARRRRLANIVFKQRGSRGRGRGRGSSFGGFNDREAKWTQKKGDSEALRIMKENRSRDAKPSDKEALKAFADLVDQMFGENAKEEAKG